MLIIFDENQNNLNNGSLMLSFAFFLRFVIKY